MAKTVFRKIAVREDVKLEISVISGVQNRPECDIIEDAMRLYKMVSFGKNKKALSLKNIEVVSLSDVIAHKGSKS